jgi:uncharacterized membrane protein
MSDNAQLRLLNEKLKLLQLKHEQFSLEIEEIRNEINLISEAKPEGVATETVSETTESVTPAYSTADIRLPDPKPKESRFSIKGNLEKFIGENLINKIGILITIFGVAIGTKYAIDNELISPLVRVLLGYTLGGVLLFFAIRLFDEMKRFSAVLLSGAMAVFYVITFTAYAYLDLFGFIPTFVIMALITLFTVWAAIQYKLQIIAQIGLVGAHAIPFLIGDDGPATTLFAYMTMINLGILWVALHYYWKELYYSSFAFTWLIYSAWYVSLSNPVNELNAALFFSLIFFVIFYLVALSYKILKKESYQRSDIWLILANAFIFYGFGYALLTSDSATANWSGLFTLANAVLHAGAATLIYKSGFTDRNLFYLISGLVVTFITIAIPVELDGNWITLLWTAEALILFIIGRKMQVPLYEKLAHPIIFLTFTSLLMDWSQTYTLYNMQADTAGYLPMLNIQFLSAMLFTGVLFYMSRTMFSDASPVKVYQNEGFNKFMRDTIIGLFVLTLYLAFRFEIKGYFMQIYITEGGDSLSAFAMYGHPVFQFSKIWIYNYTLLFIAGAAVLITDRLKDSKAAEMTFIAFLIGVFFFLIDALPVIQDLALSYYAADGEAGVMALIIRYFSFISLGVLFWFTGTLCSSGLTSKTISRTFEGVLALTLLWLLSNEWLLWAEVNTGEESCNLGVCVLWVLFAVGLIAVGIQQEKKHLRIGAIVLIAITLLKLFFYDITHLDTIAKTIVLVALGLLLLISSFLYNRFSSKIEGDKGDK